MDMAVDIASAAMDMKAAQIQQAASVMTMDKVMNSQEQLANSLISQMMNLPVGSVMPQKLDMYL